ncbi:hypothetical protein [Vibrio cholerae]|uniref:hypothetical protein n=1 Tax=Vibrio cholerae TaxID=666 RepID=UPI001F07B2F7|nr:hypothetical protein [Vibrio cholerae]MDV2339795.1 hypothetical protein [Vibrio cholerae]
MDIVFVRHGVPDYSLSDERKMSQLEKDYAPLNREYIDELKAIAQDMIAVGVNIALHLKIMWCLTMFLMSLGQN